MKNGLKFLLVAALGVSSLGAYAQNDWVNELPENGAYGIGVNKTYELIANKKLKAKATPIVALIGSGIDVEHEALKANIWVNKKEKADGKDNDGNGYIDDLNGWNFLGGKDGRTMERTLQEGDREFARIGAKYADLFFDGARYFKYVPGQIERVYVENPADMNEYNYFINSVVKESAAVKGNAGKMVALLKEYAFIFDKMLKAKFPDKTDYSMEEMASLWDKTGPQDELQNMAMWNFGMYFGNNKGTTWKDAMEMYGTDKYAQYCARTRVSKDINAILNDGRKEIVGDNIYDINDRAYGNNVLLTANAATSTMAAGIIAGERGVEGRNNPICENAQIMALCVSAGRGEPYLKDISLAIRYAVDNGASVIVLPQQNTLYPEIGKAWMVDAIRYAESKNVLLIVPAWELSFDLSQTIFFPNRIMAKDGKELTNLMVVSPSDKEGKPSFNANYGSKELDLFAPGMNMKSAYTGDTYETGTGTFLSAATTAGAAALIKSYYPELTAAQVRKLLIDNCTSRKGVELEKGIRVNGKSAQDLFLFEQLCVSGGVLNLFNVFQTLSK